MAGAYVIAFAGGKRFLRHANLPPEGVQAACEWGWRPLTWTLSLAEAEKFGSEAAAQLFLKGVPVIDELSNNGRPGLASGYVRFVPGARVPPAFGGFYA